MLSLRSTRRLTMGTPTSPLPVRSPLSFAHHHNKKHLQCRINHQGNRYLLISASASRNSFGFWVHQISIERLRSVPSSERRFQVFVSVSISVHTFSTNSMLQSVVACPPPPRAPSTANPRTKCGPAFFTCVPTRSVSLAFYLKRKKMKKSWCFPVLKNPPPGEERCCLESPLTFYFCF